MDASVYCAHCGALNQPQASTCFACARSLDEPAPAATDARRLVGSRYRLVRQLGVGGFGAVYQAEDTQLGHRLVALKEMSPRGLSAEEAQEATQAFQREALLLAGLAHPSLPRIYERFEEEGRWYLVMDFIAGETLEVYLDRQGGSLPVKEALQLALHLTQVLGYLHNRQPAIIFRDLKPSNIIRSPEGHLTLVDFGIARFFKPGQSKDTMAFGSPGYAAPEQYGKAQTTPRSDIFSLGALLHQMLTGIDPSDTPFRFAPLSMPRPAGLSALLERMVEVDESQRPSSMEGIRRELESLLDVRTPWSSDDVALRAALISSVGTAISAKAATGPVAQPVGYTAPFQPWATPQPAPKKRGKKGWWVGLAVAAFLIWQIVNGVTSHGTATSPTVSSTSTETYTYGHIDQPAIACTGTVPSSIGSGTPIPPATPTPPGTPPATPGGSRVTAYSVAWSPDGTRVASAGGDGKIAIWNTNISALMLTLETDFTSLTKVAWSPDGRMLAAIGNKDELQIWIGDNETPYAVYHIAAYGINDLSWSPDNLHIAVAGNDGAVRVVDVRNGFTLFAQSSQAINAVAWSPDGQYLAFGGADDPVEVWDYAQDTRIFSYPGHRGQINALAWSPDGSRIASTSGDDTIQIWDALTGDNSFTYPDAGSVDLAWSPDGQYLAASEGYRYTHVWAIGNANPIFIFTQQYSAYSVAWSPDARRIASSDSSGMVDMWDALTGANVVTCYQP